MINSLDAFLVSRVLIPRAFLPHGVIGDTRPIGALPSPPPCGWSTGFIADPLTVGLTPKWRLRPALPIVTNSQDSFPTCPTVARQVPNTLRTSPDCNLTKTYFSSRPRI